MSRTTRPRAARRPWRAYARRDGQSIELQLFQRLNPRCPCCGGVMEAQPRSRLKERLPLDAHAYDLNCRDCRRFWCVVRHTERSLRLLRMRRLAAAVRAVAPPVAA